MSIGTFDWATTKGTGTFLCPTCCEPQLYKRKVSRTFLTFYFIPCLPISSLSEYLQCGKCRGAYGLEHLYLHPAINSETIGLSNFSSDLVKTMACIIMVDRQIDDAEVMAAQFAYSQLLGFPMDPALLRNYCNSISTTRQTPEQFLKENKSRWSTFERKMIIQAMFWTASATGTLSQSRLYSLSSLAQVLDYKESEFRQAINETLQWKQPY